MSDSSYNAYKSKFSGAQIDEAVDRVLNGTTDLYGHIILECTESSKINLDDVLSPNTYTIAYYLNSYNDNSTVTPIVLTVTKLDAGTVEQRYSYGDGEVQRFYTSSTGTWSDWKIRDVISTNILSINSDEEVKVTQPTLVIRKMSELENKK